MTGHGRIPELAAAKATGVDAIDGAVEDDERQFWLAADVGLVRAVTSRSQP
jgi:hypothetical protein